MSLMEIDEKELKDEKDEKKIRLHEEEATKLDFPELEEIEEMEERKPEEAIKRLLELFQKENTKSELKERCIDKIGDIYAKLGKASELKQFIIDVRPFLNTVSKPKTAKIVRKLIEQMAKIPNSESLLLQICLDAIEWSTKEKRTLLKQRIQVRLAQVYLALQRYKEALQVIKSTAKDVKKFQDKLLLVEIELLESRVHLALQNVPKAKGALTSARSSANAIYCPPLLQAEIDKQAGTLCCEEKDYKTGFSYFYEAFEGYNTMNEPKQAVLCLKYMLLAKIMLNNPEDVYSIINGKAGVKYAGIEIEAMRAVADAHKNRDIHAFEAVYKKYHQQLAGDSIIFSHLSDLKNNLLEQNLLRLIEPFSRVQVSHIANLIQLPTVAIEAKLSEMILDKKLAGILDQGSGHLIVFESADTDKTYTAGLETMKELSNVVDRLYLKAKRLHHV